jgi:hypothetical protein
LADFLLERGWVGSITFHLKDRPFFVSDATIPDVETLIGRLNASRRSETRLLGLRLGSHRDAGRLKLSSDPFWTSGLMYRQMPTHLASCLARSGLVILKGDVNYRRLLDDRHWPFTTSITKCASYFPAQFVALRTLKGEIMVGLAPAKAEVLEREDPDWLVNGRRGVVQMGGVGSGSHSPPPTGLRPIREPGCGGHTRRKSGSLEREAKDA